MPDYPERLNHSEFPPPQNHDVAMTDTISTSIRPVVAWVPVNLTAGDQRKFPAATGSKPSGFPSSAVSAVEPGSRGPKKLR